VRRSAFPAQKSHWRTIADAPVVLTVIAIGHTIPVSLEGAKFQAAK
jgi:hypothetical protein